MQYRLIKILSSLHVSPHYTGKVGRHIGLEQLYQAFVQCPRVCNVNQIKLPSQAEVKDHNSHLIAKSILFMTAYCHYCISNRRNTHSFINYLNFGFCFFCTGLAAAAAELARIAVYSFEGSKGKGPALRDSAKNWGCESRVQKG
jgi:hypothetical protein